jgi:hypothetical protein
LYAIGDPAFRLTRAGWIPGLKASGTFAAADTQDRMVRLRAALKDVVKGRPLEGAFTSVIHLQGVTGLPEGWIVSALRSRLLQLHWSWDHLDVDLGRGREIWPGCSARPETLLDGSIASSGSQAFQA